MLVTEMLVNGIEVTVEDNRVLCADSELKKNIERRCVLPEGFSWQGTLHEALVGNIVGDFDGKIVSGDQFGLTPLPPDTVY